MRPSRKSPAVRAHLQYPPFTKTPYVHVDVSYPIASTDGRSAAMQSPPPRVYPPVVAQVQPDGSIKTLVTSTAAGSALTDAAAAVLGDGEISSFVSSDNFGYAAGAALVYHGYKRTGSILWALLYGLAGKEIPVVAVPVALAQGFGKKRPCP